MAKTYRPRRAPCSRCRDTVLIGEESVGRMLGLSRRGASRMWFEHADPGPNGELFDPVDDECHRPRVRSFG